MTVGIWSLTKDLKGPAPGFLTWVDPGGYPGDLVNKHQEQILKMKRLIWNSPSRHFFGYTESDGEGISQLLSF